jgi:hypothetical protein
MTTSPLIRVNPSNPCNLRLTGIPVRGSLLFYALIPKKSDGFRKKVGLLPAIAKNLQKIDKFFVWTARFFALTL